jgi:ribosome-associated protein
VSAKSIQIHTEFITLGQFIKLVGIVDTGGQVKAFLAEAEILVNGEKENRRGRKLYPDDQIAVGSNTYVIHRSKE